MEGCFADGEGVAVMTSFIPFFFAMTFFGIWQTQNYGRQAELKSKQG